MTISVLFTFTGVSNNTIILFLFSSIWYSVFITPLTVTVIIVFKSTSLTSHNSNSYSIINLFCGAYLSSNNITFPVRVIFELVILIILCVHIGLKVCSSIGTACVT